MEVFLPIAEVSVNIITIFSLSTIVGILSGLFGVGGGFLMTPFLIFLGIPPTYAVANEANNILATSVSGSTTHWLKNTLDYKMGLMIVVGGAAGTIIGILTFTVIDSMFLAYFLTMDLIINPLVTRVITHILLMPLVAGFGYEVLKITAKYKDNIIFKLLAAPGLWLQNITTKQPDDSQLEVAIAALKSAFGDSISSYEGKQHIAEAIE